MNQEKKEVKRKIVQISAIPASSIYNGVKNYRETVYALCNDGEVYYQETGYMGWVKLPPIPQD